LKKNTGFYFAPEAGDGLSLIVGSAAGAFIFRPQISHADSAIHSAGGDKEGFS
jgi:hypothetical protein